MERANISSLTFKDHNGKAVVVCSVGSHKYVAVDLQQHHCPQIEALTYDEMISWLNNHNYTICNKAEGPKKLFASQVHFSELTIGRVVQRKTIGISTSDSDDIGHIVGFERNTYNELNILVKFSKKETPIPIHLENVYVFV